MSLRSGEMSQASGQTVWTDEESVAFNFLCYLSLLWFGCEYPPQHRIPLSGQGLETTLKPTASSLKWRSNKGVDN